MRRILLVVVAAVVILKVASSDAKHAPQMRAAPRVASVPPAPPPPPPPVLEVVPDEEAVEEEEEPALEGAAEADGGIDVDVALENARVATSPNGAIQGVVRDNRSGETLPGVTVIVTSPALQGTLVAITDEYGSFRLSELPSAGYLVTLYYVDTTVEYSDVVVLPGRTTPFFHAISTEGRTFVIDPSPTVETYGGDGITIDVNYTRNIPIPGRTFESVLGSAADEQGDNTYIVDEQPADPCAVIE